MGGSMKIYFSASITGGRDPVLVQAYQRFVSHLQKKGVDVLTEHVSLGTLTAQGEVATGKTPIEIWKRDLDMIVASEGVIAEVTVPSLGVGYELGIAEKLGKPVLCLYQHQDGKILSSMILGNPNFDTRDYSTLEEGCTHIDAFLSRLKK